MATKSWKDLSPRTRRLLLAGAAVDGGLKAAALFDLRRRPASEIRGSKRVWVPVVAIVNSAGLIPLYYFFFGRRRGAGD
jgi:hypothetical protein